MPGWMFRRTPRRQSAWWPQPKAKIVERGVRKRRTMRERQRQMNKSSALKSFVPMRATRLRSVCPRDALDDDALELEQALVDGAEHETEGQAQVGQHEGGNGQNRARAADDAMVLEQLPCGQGAKNDRHQQQLGAERTEARKVLAA